MIPLSQSHDHYLLQNKPTMTHLVSRQHSTTYHSRPIKMSQIDVGPNNTIKSISYNSTS